jgi:uncharacterized protein YaiE (UPF0345 family)
MKQLPESLGALGVEGRVDGMRPGGAPAQRRLKTTLVEEMDGVAGALGVAAEAAGDLVGVLAPGAGEKYLAPAEDESIRRAQACLQGLALGVRDRTHKDWSSHVVEDNSSTTASSEYALATFDHLWESKWNPIRNYQTVSLGTRVNSPKSSPFGSAPRLLIV